MISVRVNEILKYLSSDKKERLKKCVLAMENVPKLDNTRTQRNNLTNTLSSFMSPLPPSSAMAVAVSVAGEPVSQRPHPGSQLHKTIPLADARLKQTIDKEGFHSNAGDSKLEKDYKKRRPLTVIKNHNISPSISENSSKVQARSPNIPVNSPTRDVKLNELKMRVSAKSETRTNSSPAVSAEEAPKDAELNRKSQQEASDVIPAAKGKTKHIASQKLSKQKTVVSQEVEGTSSETSSVTDQDDNTPVRKAPPSAEDSDILLLPNTGSPQYSSSRKNKKQNRAKDTALGKIRQETRGSTRESSPSTEVHRPSVSKVLPDVNQTRCVKLPSREVGFGLGGWEKKRSTSSGRKGRLGVSMCGALRINGYKSTSGVAELDTFEMAPTKKKTCRKHAAGIPPSHEVNSLDTFDEPVVAPGVCQKSDEVSVAESTKNALGSDENWIEVNRKVRRIVVPLNVVSCILGPDGSKLEAICHVTKAHIEHEKTTSHEATFLLRGSVEQMQAASCVINALVKGCNPSDPVTNGCTAIPLKISSSYHRPAHQTSKPEARHTSKEPKLRAKLQQSTLTSCDIVEKIGPTQTQANVQQDEEYPESVKSGLSERSDGQNGSERGSPAQELLIGEYSLFEHGLGQPLEKLLAFKESSKQTFARAAASRTSSRTLTMALPDQCIADQTLLAKAPGYRNVKPLFGCELCCRKAGDLSSTQLWQAFPGGGCDAVKDCKGSHSPPSDFPLCNPENDHIPVLERPTSAPGLAHSTVTLSDGQSHHPDHPAAIQVFSKLNPNAPDFIFAMPPKDNISSQNTGSGFSSITNQSSRLPELETLESTSATSLERSDSAFSYALSHIGNRFKPSLEILDSTSREAGRCGSGFATSGSGAADETAALGGSSVVDSVSGPWICSQDSWHPSKMSYGVSEGEHLIPHAASGGSSYHHLRGEYFTHPTTRPIASSTFNCAFYQQQKQHLMLAPAQSWSHHGSQTVAPAGP